MKIKLVKNMESARNIVNEKYLKENRLLKVSEVSEILNISFNTVYNYIREGRIKAYRIGRLWRIPASEIEKLLKEKS